MAKLQIDHSNQNFMIIDFITANVLKNKNTFR